MPLEPRGSRNLKALNLQPQGPIDFGNGPAQVLLPYTLLTLCARRV